MKSFWQKIIINAVLCMMPFHAVAEGINLGLTSNEIDQIVHHAMDVFDVPGIAVGIIKNGKVVHSKGYGIRNLSKSALIDDQSLFSIGSTGKSFTAVALALLIEDGKMTWDDKVIDHIPDFRLYDPWVTREFTVRDLLIHNSGLGLGAGDLMFFPSPGFSRQEIIQNLRHLKPVSSFRTKYAYDNLMYIVAGEVIAAVSGISYEGFIEQKILRPLGMNHCAENLKEGERFNNLADPHVVESGKLKTIERDVKPGKEIVFSAAGGMLCSVDSILKWHNMFLNKGLLPNGEPFLSGEQVAEILTPQTIIPVKAINKKWFGSSFPAFP